VTSPPARWYLLVHQLPPRPLYLRAKVRQRLARVGAVALKNSVYVLPARPECLEDLQWIAQEAEAGGGEAFVCAASFLSGVEEGALERRFQEERAADYRAWSAEARRGLEAGTEDSRERLKKRWAEIRAIDFFDAPAGKEAGAMLTALERKTGGGPGAKGGGGARDLVGKVWVTRHDVHVDRIATAWLVRRFIDARARFRFIDPAREQPRAGEIGFDMVGGRFTHEGDRCTFETVLRRLGSRDRALGQVAEIVHDLDLKDGKYGRPEAAGVRQLLAGLYAVEPDDEKRLARGAALFDDLHASFVPGRAPESRAGRGRARRGPKSRPGRRRSARRR
jgi:hypothetical protein